MKKQNTRQNIFKKLWHWVTDHYSSGYICPTNNGLNLTGVKFKITFKF